MEHFSTGTSGDIKLEELDIKTEFNDEDSLSNQSDDQFNAVIFGTKYNTETNHDIFNTDNNICEDNKTNFEATIKDNLDPKNNISSVHKRKKTHEISIGEENVKNEHSFYSDGVIDQLQYDFDHEIVVKDELDYTEQFLMNPIHYDEVILGENEDISSNSNLTCKKRNINIVNQKSVNFSHRKANEISIKEEILSDNEIISEIVYQKEIHSRIQENVKTRKENSKTQSNVKTRKEKCSNRQENAKTRKEKCSNRQENAKTRKESTKTKENLEISLLTPISEKKTYMCNDCGYNFNHLGNLKRHISRIHTYTENTQAFSCSNCAFKCSNESTLEKHRKEHKIKPFSCDLCDYTTRRRNGLNRHLKTHTGEKKYKCEICNRKCTTKRGLEFHIMIHSGKKPFSCDKCDFKAVNKHDVTRHGRIHTGEKPFSCEICGYACIRKYHLGLHMRKHIGEH